MASAPTAAAAGKGGKPKPGRPAKEVLDELMAERRAEIRALGPSPAMVILSIDGLGYKAADGQFSEKKPAKTKGKASVHMGSESFLQQFYITVGFGKGFSGSRLVAVSNPAFFKGGDVGRGKIIDGVLNVGDYVLTRAAEGLATMKVAMSHGASSTMAVEYQDLYAVIPKAEVPDWIRSGSLYMDTR
jgi:hypothetical protein